MAVFRSFLRKPLEKAFQKALSFVESYHLSRNDPNYPVLTCGPSMLPTIGATTSIFVAERISPKFCTAATRRDIVVVRLPHKRITKRLVGLEGDTITYFSDPNNNKKKKKKTIVVPKGHVWVEGDNKSLSRDSRNFGPVPYRFVEGRLIWQKLVIKVDEDDHKDSH